MANDDMQPKVNSLLRELHSRGDGDTLIVVKGFVGEVPDGFVRIYPSLTALSYVDIRREDIIHFTDSEQDDQPATLYVTSSADLKIVHIRSTVMKARSLQRARKTRFGCGCGSRSRTLARRRLDDEEPSSGSDYDCEGGCDGALLDCLYTRRRPDEECWNDHQLCIIICDLIASDEGTGGLVIF